MTRLQFRHLDYVFDNREEAINYLRKIVNCDGLVDNQAYNEEFGGESLIGEPLVVKYKDETEKVNVILAIGVSSGNTEYHYIDSAKFAEDIEALTDVTDEIRAQLEAEIERINELNDRVDAVEDSIDEINTKVDDLSNSVVKTISINTKADWEGETGKGVEAVVENNEAYIDLTTDNIIIPDGQEGTLIHHDHSLTDFITNVEGLHLELISDGLEANVREAYKLVTGDGTQLGNTIVKVYKDQTLKSVVLDDQELVLTYILADGSESEVRIDVSAFLAESEFKDGLQVINGEVSVKVDPTSESFLSVGENGVKVSGVQNAIDAAVFEENNRAEEAEAALQYELDEAQAGAGLNPDGSYVHDHTANYIDEATSLADADHRLDTALKSVSDNLESLTESTQGLANKVDDLEQTVSDGNDELRQLIEKETTDRKAVTGQDGDTYKAHNTDPDDLTTYIKTAKSMDEADVILDTKLAELSASTVSEIERAASKDAEHDNAISDMSNRMDTLEGKTIIGSKAIKVEGEPEKVVSLLLLEDEKVLSQSESGLKTTLSVDILKENDKDYIILKGVNDEEISRVDATTFIKDGMLDSVEWIEDTNILEFVFNTDAGKETIRINFSKFVNDEVNRQIEEIKEAVNILNGDITVPGSVDHTIDDRLVKYAVAGSAVDANGTLLRYYEDATGHKYYVSNKAEDMTFGGRNLGDVLTEIIENEGASEDIERLENRLNSEILRSTQEDTNLNNKIDEEIQRSTQEDERLDNKIDEETTRAIEEETEIWSALTQEINDREDTEKVISAALNDLNSRINELSGGTGSFASAEYDSTTKEIVFKDKNGNVVSSIDATAFIKDGMVENVEVTDDSLVITFNTESGKEAISIPLTSFFDKSVYYTKEELDLTNKVISASLNDLNDRIIELSGRTVDLSNYYTKDEVDEQISSAFTDVYTKEEIDNDHKVISASLNDLNDRIKEVSGKTVDLTGYATETWVNQQINNESDQLVSTAEYNSTTKQIVFNNKNGDAISTIDATAFIKDGMVENAEVVGDNLVITFNTDAGKEAISIPLTSFFDKDKYLTSGETVNMIESALTAYYTKEELDLTEKVISASLNDLNDRINEVSGRTVDLSNYYTKDETYDRETIDSKIRESGTFDPTQYYTKNEINTIVSDFVDSGDVKTQIESYNFLTEHQSLNGLVSDVEYVSSAKTIVFKDKAGNTVDTIDTSDFVKDGMVSNVEVVGDNLVITFNTDAGKQPISIPLTSFFDEDKYLTSGETVNMIESALTAYYTKDETDLAHKVISASLNDLNDRVLELSGRTVDLSNYYTKEEVDTKIASGGTFDPTLYYNKTESDARFTTTGEVKTQIESYGYTTNTGTITGINMNGASKGTSGVVDLGTVITSETQLSKGTVSGSGNAVTDINVNNHEITLVKGATFTTTGDVKTQIESYEYVTSAQTVDKASKLSHNVTIGLTGEVNGSTTTDFSTNNVNINTYKTFANGTLSNMTFENFLTLCNVATNETISISNDNLVTVSPGCVKEAHVIITNTSSSNVAITLPTSDSRVKITGNNTTFTIMGNSIGEFNALITNNNGNYVIYIITT